MSDCLLAATLSGCGGFSPSSSGSGTATQTSVESSASSSSTVAPTNDNNDEPSQIVEGSGIEPLETEATTEFPLCEEKETLTYFNEISTNLMNAYDDLNDAEAVKYLEELTNVHIDFTSFVSDNYIDQCTLMMASGDMTDIIYTGAGSYPGGVSAAVEDEIVVDLNEYLEYAPNYASILEELPDVRRAVYTDEGYLPAFYAIYDENARFTSGMVVRQDWLDELDLDVPVTYDDYYEVLTAFKSNYNCSSPILMGYNGMIGGDWLIAGYGLTLPLSLQRQL